MSAIYFRSNDDFDDFDDAEISGSERASMSIKVSEFQEIIFQNFSKEKILSTLEDKSSLYFKDYPEKEFKESFALSMNVNLFNNLSFVKGNEKSTPFSLVLNTAMKQGSDPVKLMARLHGQCEIHTYIMPENFVWLSNIIKQGLADNIFRENEGWRDLMRLLGESNSPIVRSYSVCDSFPNNLLVCMDEDKWENLSNSKQFEMAIEELKKMNMLEITPEKWEDYYFDKGLSALDF